MPVFLLSEHYLDFPPPHLASPEGVLAIGGDLSPERLLYAYERGIFPWFNEDEPILWWCPNPRFVLYPHELKVSKSMRPLFNRAAFRVSFDTCFSDVMEACGDRQDGTWITPDMIEAYTRLHQMGYAHSVEVWQDDQLVGGLYGLALGKVFFGESMFARVSNASKYGFITLVQCLIGQGYTLIDCQQETTHLASLGARAIPRATFLQHLETNRQLPNVAARWVL